MQKTILASLVLICAACSNPVCADDVRKRILDDCLLTVSSTAFECITLPDTPPAEQLQAAQDAHNKSACEISDPDLDVDCLKTASCEDIERGACGSGSSMPDPVKAACNMACNNALQMCSGTCGAESSGWSVCLDCDLDCVRAAEDCFSKC